MKLSKILAEIRPQINSSRIILKFDGDLLYNPDFSDLNWVYDPGQSLRTYWQDGTPHFRGFMDLLRQRGIKFEYLTRRLQGSDLNRIIIDDTQGQVKKYFYLEKDSLNEIKPQLVGRPILKYIKNTEGLWYIPELEADEEDPIVFEYNGTELSLEGLWRDEFEKYINFFNQRNIPFKETRSLNYECIVITHPEKYFKMI